MAYRLIPLMDNLFYNMTRRAFPELYSPRHSLPLPSTSHWLADFEPVARIGDYESSVSKTEDGLHLAIDVGGFKPENLKVDLKGNELTMSGKLHEKSSDGSVVERSFTRKYTLPENVELEKIASSLTADGQTLRIQVPWKTPAIEDAPAKETPIAINVHK